MMNDGNMIGSGQTHLSSQIKNQPAIESKGTGITWGRVVRVVAPIIAIGGIVAACLTSGIPLIIAGAVAVFGGALSLYLVYTWLYHRNVAKVSDVTPEPGVKTACSDISTPAHTSLQMPSVPAFAAPNKMDEATVPESEKVSHPVCTAGSDKARAGASARSEMNSTFDTNSAVNMPVVDHCMGELFIIPDESQRRIPEAGRKLKVDNSSTSVEDTVGIPNIGSLSIYKGNNTKANSSEKQDKLHDSHPEATTLIPELSRLSKDTADSRRSISLNDRVLEPVGKPLTLGNEMESIQVDGGDNISSEIIIPGDSYNDPEGNVALNSAREGDGDKTHELGIQPERPVMGGQFYTKIEAKFGLENCVGTALHNIRTFFKSTPEDILSVVFDEDKKFPAVTMNEAEQLQRKYETYNRSAYSLSEGEGVENGVQRLKAFLKKELEGTAVIEDYESGELSSTKDVRSELTKWMVQDTKSAVLLCINGASKRSMGHVFLLTKTRMSFVLKYVNPEQETIYLNKLNSEEMVDFGEKYNLTDEDSKYEVSGKGDENASDVLLMRFYNGENEVRQGHVGKDVDINSLIENIMLDVNQHARMVEFGGNTLRLFLTYFNEKEIGHPKITD
ncbi:hypothetical protein [Endozoicomonas sp.]|uniref:hypothetical protein n=1 Tax=Endozoicomonas sp. TaxID=1892382 RepID=UPI002888E6CF|nr:hypothetical protein [Endozoicomonas sp.]